MEMGTLRFLLAITVIIAHSTVLFGLHMVGGPTAVQTFYIISGFYMALILESKYVGPGSYRLFISNRSLRIFPMYWVILFLVCLSSLIIWMSTNDAFVFSAYARFWHSLGFIPLILLALTNLGIIGQDIMMFLKFSPDFHWLVPTRSFWTSDPKIYEFLLIPQAWTVSVELLFYLIAPFITRISTRMLGLLAVASLLLRAVLYANGLSFDPWTYRFFPTEILFFIAGILAFRYQRKISAWPMKNWYVTSSTGVVLFCTIFFDRLPNIFSLRQIAYFGLILMCMPFLFRFTNRWKFDRWLGELSYPIYIGHFLILSLLGFFFKNSPHYLERYSYYALIGSLLLALGLLYGVAHPIEKIRQRRAAAFLKQ